MCYDVLNLHGGFVFGYKMNRLYEVEIMESWRFR